jgi:hypothetical protein
MKYTQRIINNTINQMSKQFDLSDEDVVYYTKQLELLVDAVTYDFKQIIQSIEIQKSNTHENSNQGESTSN